MLNVSFCHTQLPSSISHTEIGIPSLAQGQGLHIRDAAKHVADLAAASRAAADQGQLQQPAAQYDCIMLDCFDNNAEVPSQFLAQVFISDCRQIVPEGVSPFEAL